MVYTISTISAIEVEDGLPLWVNCRIVMRSAVSTDDLSNRKDCLQDTDPLKDVPFNRALLFPSSAAPILAVVSDSGGETDGRISQSV